MKYIVIKKILQEDNASKTPIKRGTELFLKLRDCSLDYDNPNFLSNILVDKSGNYIMDVGCLVYEECVKEVSDE